LEGFALYYATATRSAKLVLIGTGPLEFSLKRLAEELRIHDRVVWAGFREDIPVVMNTLDVFALTSVYEGFGLVLLEAMASGRPVVASSVSAIPEILLDRVTGILFPPARTDLLAAAFRQLESDSYREFLGRNGRERVKTEFTVEKMVESTDKVYGATQGERK
jgi:glycosyltransferase involved in cell wall biosynthesis